MKQSARDKLILEIYGIAGRIADDMPGTEEQRGTYINTIISQYGLGVEYEVDLNVIASGKLKPLLSDLKEMEKGHGKRSRHKRSLDTSI